MSSSERVKISPDEVLNDLGAWNRQVLTCVIICGLAWVPIGMTGLCPAIIVKSPPNSSFVAMADEFNLTSKDLWIAEATTTSYMIGNMFGATLIPPLADRYGRLPIFISMLIGICLAGCVSAIVGSLLMINVFRFIHGIFYTAAGLVGWVLGYENSPLKLRFFTSVFFGLAWVLGACLLSVIAYFTSTWRTLMLVICVPNLVTAALVFFLAPESLHYLVSEKKTKKVAKWMEKAGNSTIIADDVVDDKKENPLSLVELIREIFEHKIFLLYVGVMNYLWVVDTFIYFGLSFYATNLSGNFYVNFALMSLVEAPSYVIAPMVMNRFGRRFLVAGAHILAGISFSGNIFFDEHHQLPFWLTGKFAISCSFMSLYVYGSEVFPTDGRNKFIGLCEMTSRIGAILSPYLSNLTVIAWYAPTVVLMATSILGGLLTLLLPETINQKLPATIKETSNRKLVNLTVE